MKVTFCCSASVVTTKEAVTCKKRTNGSGKEKKGTEEKRWRKRRMSAGAQHLAKLGGHRRGMCERKKRRRHAKALPEAHSAFSATTEGAHDDTTQFVLHQWGCDLPRTPDKLANGRSLSEVVGTTGNNVLMLGLDQIVQCQQRKLIDQSATLSKLRCACTLMSLS